MEALTWTGLLAQWIDFAKASVALPDDAGGRAWRASVPCVINLQAVTFALAELRRLPEVDRPAARDRADVLIRESVQALQRHWRGQGMPQSLHEVCEDAIAALEASAYAGSVQLNWRGPGSFVMPSLQVKDEVGTVALMQPGTIVMEGEPVAWWIERDGCIFEDVLKGCERSEPPVPEQVYRQIDGRGRMVRDVVLPITAEPVAGLPLLVPLLLQGNRIGHFTVEASQWEARQRSAMPEAGIEVTRVEG